MHRGRASYKHSQVFASLKGISEQIEDNLTTSQYLQSYDAFLERSVIPIITGTRVFDVFVSRLVGWQEKNFRRKVTFLSRAEVPGLVVNFLLQTSPEKRVEAYRRLNLDRGVCIEFLKLFQDLLVTYRQACNCELKNPVSGKFDLGHSLHVKATVEANLRATQPLMSTYLESKFWFDRALEFKQRIMEKYVRLCLTTAKKDYVSHFKMEVDLDDVIQYYLMATSRAIDKCDYRQGVLTSYIQNWFLTARTRVSKLIDQRKLDLPVEVLDFSSEEFRSAYVEDQSVEGRRHSEELRRTTRQLARVADPLGVARAYLGIEEHLKDSEIESLKNLANSYSSQ